MRRLRKACEEVVANASSRQQALQALLQRLSERTKQRIAQATPGLTQGERFLAGHSIAWSCLAVLWYPYQWSCTFDGCDHESWKLAAIFSLGSYLMMRCSMLDRAWRKKHGETQ